MARPKNSHARLLKWRWQAIPSTMRLCLDRLFPPRRTRPIDLELPKVETAGDVLKAHAAVIDAMAQGGITPDEASTVSSVLEVKRRSIETCELEARITELENARG